MTPIPEEEEEEFIQNCIRARRDSYEMGPNTLSHNAWFNQSADKASNWAEGWGGGGRSQS